MVFDIGPTLVTFLYVCVGLLAIKYVYEQRKGNNPNG